MNQTPLPATFAPNTPEEWKAAAEALLKGAPFDKVMRTATPEGITLEPIYRQEALENLAWAAGLPGDAASGYARGTSAAGYRLQAWDIAQELPYGDPAEFNRNLLADLARGQNAVNVLLDIATVNGQDPDAAPAGQVGACGVSLASLADFKKAFQGVLPEAVSFHFQSGCGGLAVEALFLAWLKEKGVAPAGVRGGLNMDPLGMLAASGTLPTSLDRAYEEMAVLAAFNARNMPEFAAVGASGMPLHSAGASSTQELGAALASGVAYLRALLARGLDIDSAARQIRFTLAIGPNFFMELAKFRAARPLWARIVTEFGGGAEAAKLRLHGRTGLYNKTVHDPYVNMLRTTTEALSGVLGGVDSLCVGTFDECIRTPDEFARRIARNTQVILQEECELTSVVDPAGGSWFVEWLTDQVARKAWEFFQEIEAAGGYAEALASGWLQEKTGAVRIEKEKMLSQRRMALVGTNQYPNPSEKPLAVQPVDYAAIQSRRAREMAAQRLAADHETDVAVMASLENLLLQHDTCAVERAVDAVRAGATVGEITRALRGHAGPAPAVQALPNTRLARSYEELRAAAAAYGATQGTGPKIHLATLGALRRHKARVDFIRAFFETGGFEINVADGSMEPAEVAAKALDSKARIIVICGHDEDYPTLVPAVLEALKAKDPGLAVLLAGHPGDHESAFRAAGLDDFVFVRSNNYETNRKYLARLGVLPA